MTFFQHRKKSLLGLLAAVALGTAIAQDYPARPVRMVLPFPPGGTGELFTRIIGNKFQELTGQPLVPDYRPGATGIIGSTAVARSTPDGYTLLYTSNSSHVVAPMLQNPRPYDPVKDFTPVAPTTRYPFLMVVHPEFAARTLAEFVAAAKAQPGKLNYGSAGLGSAPQLSTELLLRAARINVVHVAYKGPAALQLALISGEVQMSFDTPGTARSHVLAGKMRPLAVTGSRRSPALPEVPTFAEAGYPGVEGEIWQGIFGPAGLPEAIVKKLNDIIVQAVASPEFQERTRGVGIEPVQGTPEALAAELARDLPRWERIVAEVGLKPK
jgi:tripartite-type tricarboxylate transporter receptor subunit TctC